MSKGRRSAAARKGWATRKANAKAAAKAAAALARKRSKAALQGWSTRRGKKLVGYALQPFTEALTTGASGPTIRRTHDAWLRARELVKPAFTDAQWRSILDDVGDDLDLPSDFVDALEESPES
jgi:hypothetical protein